MRTMTIHKSYKITPFVEMVNILIHSTVGYLLTLLTFSNISNLHGRMIVAPYVPINLNIKTFFKTLHPHKACYPGPKMNLTLII